MVVVRVWNASEKEKMMARLRKTEKGGKCPTLEALPAGWNRINVRKLNGIRAKYYLAPSGMRYWHLILFRPSWGQINGSGCLELSVSVFKSVREAPAEEKCCSNGIQSNGEGGLKTHSKWNVGVLQ